MEPASRQDASGPLESRYLDPRRDVLRTRTDAEGTAESQPEAWSSSLDGRDRVGVASNRLHQRDDELRAPRNLQVLQEWEGTVESVDEKKQEFVAVVRDVTTPSHPEEEVTLSMSEVSPSDRSLLLPYAIFYWTIGYETTELGQIRRFSQIRFRRLPPLTKADQERAIDAARRLAQAFGIPGEAGGTGACDG